MNVGVEQDKHFHASEEGKNVYKEEVSVRDAY